MPKTMTIYIIVAVVLVALIVGGVYVSKRNTSALGYLNLKSNAPEPLNSKKCKETNLHRAKCMIELILEDLSANYGAIGGGISSIKAGSSTSYIVSLPQEERVDIFTYEFEIKNDVVGLKSKVASTQSFSTAKN